MAAAIHGQIDVLKILAPLTKFSNIGGWMFGKNAIQCAQNNGHLEFARWLQTFINTRHAPHF